MENNMDLAILEKVIVHGDLSVLTPQERYVYYTKVCEDLGLNPLTRPFDYLELKNGKEKKMFLYAKKECTDQLRRNYKITVDIVSVNETSEELWMMARATMPDGRTDTSIGSVPLLKEETVWNKQEQRYVSTGKIVPLGFRERSNARMACETKAKRRVTLSIVGLGMLDESEISSIEGAETLPAEIREDTESKPLQEKPKSPTQPSKSNKAGKSVNKPSTASQQTEQTPKVGTASDTYKLLDYATGTSPGGVVFAKLLVANMSTGEQCIMIANTPETIEQTNALSNNSQFKINFELLNGFNIVESVAIVGEAA
ncbi:hypothetical protein [Paenibacillus massiliensis]|uniref:hypothetical protein n=1 Tax=Paenibacillus massiliensis TaxID=225917 RepID=UPI0003F712BA|nr:hypothetical protein [Paenibacillus massiliensis]